MVPEMSFQYNSMLLQCAPLREQTAEKSSISELAAKHRLRERLRGATTSSLSRVSHVKASLRRIEFQGRHTPSWELISAGTYLWKATWIRVITRHPRPQSSQRARAIRHTPREVIAAYRQVLQSAKGPESTRKTAGERVLIKEHHPGSIMILSSSSETQRVQKLTQIATLRPWSNWSFFALFFEDIPFFLWGGALEAQKRESRIARFPWSQAWNRQNFRATRSTLSSVIAVK